MKVINIEMLEGIPDSIQEEDYSSLDEGCGINTIDGVQYPHCYCCMGSTEIMIRLVDIDDGCMNDYLCANCIKKIAALLEEVT